MTLEINEKEAIYEYLFLLRKSGAVNMFGSVPHAQKQFPELDKKEVRATVLDWMQNYSKIAKKLGYDEE